MLGANLLAFCRVINILTYEEVSHVPPKRILAELLELEREIEAGLKELEGMLQ